VTHPDRAAFLVSPIGALPGYWLAVECCAVPAKVPLLWLSKQIDPRTTVAQVLPRLVCQRCGARAERVEAVDNPAAGAFGRGVQVGEEWRLVLRP
jgi:hypothetical protein